MKTNASEHARTERFLAPWHRRGSVPRGTCTRACRAAASEAAGPQRDTRVTRNRSRGPRNRSHGRQTLALRTCTVVGVTYARAVRVFGTVGKCERSRVARNRNAEKVRFDYSGGAESLTVPRYCCCCALVFGDWNRAAEKNRNLWNIRNLDRNPSTNLEEKNRNLRTKKKIESENLTPWPLKSLFVHGYGLERHERTGSETGTFKIFRIGTKTGTHIKCPNGIMRKIILNRK